MQFYSKNELCRALQEQEACKVQLDAGKKVAPGRRSLSLPYGLDKNPEEGIMINMKAGCNGNVIWGFMVMAVFTCRCKYAYEVQYHIY